MDEIPHAVEEVSRQPAPLVLVFTGMSGAGRTSAVAALEDLGYEALNNFPLSMFEALVEPVVGTSAPIAIGVSARTRGFSARALTDTVDRLRNRWRAGTVLVFLDCSNDELISRYSQTRRRHPMALADDAATGVARERSILSDVRDRADVVIDTSGMTPHELKSEIAARFALDRSTGLSVSVRSFSYKRGAPHGSDMVMDCRFLQNPYWDESLRALDGQDPAIQGFVMEDPLYEAFFGKLCGMLDLLLPAYRKEGKAHFTIAFGCTGGRHRSVTMAEAISLHLRETGVPVSLRHQELERMQRRTG